jgi:hypothetical protein
MKLPLIGRPLFTRILEAASQETTDLLFTWIEQIFTTLIYWLCDQFEADLIRRYECCVTCFNASHWWGTRAQMLGTMIHTTS